MRKALFVGLAVGAGSYWGFPGLVTVLVVALVAALFWKE